MASIGKYNGRWQVTYRPVDGRPWTSKRFDDEQSARQFLEAGDFLPDQRKFNTGGRKTPRSTAQVMERIAAMSALTDDGCMEWQGAIGTAGYGTLNWLQADGSTIRGAHRIAYHVFVAPVHPDLVIDHLCRNTKCVRPDHLEMVTNRENVMRSPVTLALINSAKTHCPHGHQYSPENTYVFVGKNKRKSTNRVCRTCQHNHYLRRRDANIGRKESA